MTALSDRRAGARPSRGVKDRLRLAPLGLLMVCVLAAALVGVVVDGSNGTVAAAPPQARLTDPASGTSDRAASACTPGFDSETSSAPWSKAKRRSSEKVFQQRLASEHPSYVRGRHRRLIFRDQQADNFSQALGRVTQTAKQRKAWATFLKRAQRSVQRRGGEFHVVVAPAEWDVYRQDLPSWATKLRGTTSLEKLMAAHPEIPWIDTRAALRAAARKNHTYEPLNTHWTPYGGYVAWKTISACLRLNPELASVAAPPLKRVKIGPNLNEFAGYGVPDGKKARTSPVYAAKHPRTTITHIPDGEPVANMPDDTLDLVFLPARTITKKAQTDKTLLVLRDSTGSALSPLWSWSFEETIQYPHGIGSAFKTKPIRGLVKKFDPDVVLYVITERYLAFPPISQGSTF